MTTTIDRPCSAAAAPLPARAAHRALVPTLVGIAAPVSGIAIGVDSMRGDEAASVMSAHRPSRGFVPLSQKGTS